MRTIKELINEEKRVYIILKTKAIQYRFMSDAEREGVTYGDGVCAIERLADDIMSLKADGTICYVGFAGRVLYHHLNDKCIMIDYEKYVDGDSGYIIK